MSSQPAKDFLQENMIPHVYHSGFEVAPNIWECTVSPVGETKNVRVLVYLDEQDFEVEDY